jgi:hypothetical protein
MSGVDSIHGNAARGPNSSAAPSATQQQPAAQRAGNGSAPSGNSSLVQAAEGVLRAAQELGRFVAQRYGQGGGSGSTPNAASNEALNRICHGQGPRDSQGPQDQGGPQGQRGGSDRAGGSDGAHAGAGVQPGAGKGPSGGPPPSGPASNGELYRSGAPGQKDQWGDSHNVNKPEVFRQVLGSVQKNWNNGCIPDNVKDLFSGSKTDPYFEGLKLSSDPTKRAQEKAAIWELATASHETGNTYDPSKRPSYWEAGGSGSHAGQTQNPGMTADPKGMTYGMFSTYSKQPIDVSDPKRAVVADLHEFGAKYQRLNSDLPKTLELIGQTDSTSLIPSIKAHGAEYLEAFRAAGR